MAQSDKFSFGECQTGERDIMTMLPECLRLKIYNICKEIVQILQENTKFYLDTRCHKKKYPPKT